MDYKRLKFITQTYISVYTDYKQIIHSIRLTKNPSFQFKI